MKKLLIVTLLVLGSLPATYAAEPSAINSTETLCPICHDDFETGDEVVTLPCHETTAYHLGCITAWGKKKGHVSCTLCTAVAPYEVTGDGVRFPRSAFKTWFPAPATPIRPESSSKLTKPSQMDQELWDTLSTEQRVFILGSLAQEARPAAAASPAMAANTVQIDQDLWDDLTDAEKFFILSDAEPARPASGSSHLVRPDGIARELWESANSAEKAFMLEAQGRMPSLQERVMRRYAARVADRWRIALPERKHSQLNYH
jgi:Ring finger domain